MTDNQSPHIALVEGTKDVAFIAFPSLVYYILTKDSENAWLIFCLLFWAKFLLNILQFKRL